MARLLLLLALLGLVGCASMRTVDVDAAMRNSTSTGVDYGKRVKLETLDGRRAEFRITDITPDGIGGQDGFFPYADMRSLRIEHSSPRSSEDTWAIVLGVIGLIGLVALVNNADSVAVCSPGACPQPQP
jgi:hypothetical protein